MNIYDDNRTVNNKDTDDMVSPTPESLELDELKRIIGIAENCIISMKKQIGAKDAEIKKRIWENLNQSAQIDELKVAGIHKEAQIQALKQENEGLRNQLQEADNFIKERQRDSQG